MMMVGLTVTVIGISVVFCFLLLIIVGMSTMSSVIMKYFPEPEEPVVSVRKAADNSEVAVAIAAVQAYTNS